MITEHGNIAVLEPDVPATGQQTNPGTFIDLKRAEMAVRNLLMAPGEDPNREGLADTPRRVAKMYRELFAGISVDPALSTRALSLSFSLESLSFCFDSFLITSSSSWFCFASLAIRLTSSSLLVPVIF